MLHILEQLGGGWRVLSRAEMLQMRQGVTAFCSKDNLDCPEIMKLMGR